MIQKTKELEAIENCDFEDGIPVDAAQASSRFIHINPADKYKRGVALNPVERNSFSSICEFRADQLIKCYRYWDTEWNWLDFVSACANCPHCLYDAKLIPTSTVDFVRISTEAKCSLWGPVSLFRSLLPHLGDTASMWCVYFITDGFYVKIGKTNCVKKRISELQTGNGRELQCMFTIPAKTSHDAYAIESILHSHFRGFRLYGEWFDIKDHIVAKDWQHAFCFEPEETDVSTETA